MNLSLSRISACLITLFLFVCFENAQAKPFKVYILAGQSNMQGHARLYTFEHIGMDPKTAPLLAEMQDEKGEPRVCKNVWISYLSQDLEKNGKLTAGFGADDAKIG